MGKRRPYASPYFSPGRGVAAEIAGFIDRTKHTLDCAVYSITHPDIAAALIRAHERGVIVRVLIDKVQAAGRYALDEQIEAAGVPLLRDRRTGLMHSKFAVSDAGSKARAVLMGSFNWTRGADRHNVEDAAIIRLSYFVHAYAERFAELWALNLPDDHPDAGPPF